MGMIVTKKTPYGEVNGVFKYLVEVRCDYITDITPPNPEWHLGSIAAVLDAQSIFMLNSSGEWVKIDS